MGNAGSALALKTGRASIVLAAAAELPKPMRLHHALRVLLVLLESERDRYPPAATRFAVKLASERRLSLAETQLCLAALQTLPDRDPVPGGEALCAMLERHGEHQAANHLEDWLRARDG